MNNWTADFVNDPQDDYNLVVELLLNDEDIGVIKKVNSELELKLYASEKELSIPVDWLSGLLTAAKEKLI